ncbi:MAG: hypothetical protein ACI8RD_000148 [Bacillariaceae sp.]|jgi:hypothetical protein
MYCKTSVCLTRIRQHEETCPSNPNSKTVARLRQQQECLQNYTPSANSVILQTESQRRKKESNPQLIGNDRMEDLTAVNQNSFCLLQKAKKESAERIAVVGKIVKTIEASGGYFVHYYKLKTVKYKLVHRNEFRTVINRMFNDHHIE